MSDTAINMKTTKYLSWVRRRVMLPVLGLLRMGATPERLAWSLAAGIVVGINPLLGSTTILSLLVAWGFRLNLPASQVGTHTSYPLQVLLFLPFVHFGAVLFHTGEMPLHKAEIVRLARHPWALTKLLWMWEWHALVVWAAISVVMLPALAWLLRVILRRAMPTVRHA